MVRAILTGVLAVTCVACAGLRSVSVAPECREARQQPPEAVQALREREVRWIRRH